jgi:hypothetical protein
MGSNPTRGMNVRVRLFYACVVLCVGSGQADPPSEESYRLYIDQETEKAAYVHKDCRTIDR